MTSWTRQLKTGPRPKERGSRNWLILLVDDDRRLIPVETSLDLATRRAKPAGAPLLIDRQRNAAPSTKDAAPSEGIGEASTGLGRIYHRCCAEHIISVFCRQDYSILTAMAPRENCVSRAFALLGTPYAVAVNDKLHHLPTHTRRCSGADRVARRDSLARRQTIHRYRSARA